MHEISSLKDWTVDGDALGYYLLALSKKRGGKCYNVTIADLALTLTLMTCVSINQSILLYYPFWSGIEGDYMNKPSGFNPWRI